MLAVRGDLAWLPLTALATATMFLGGVAVAERLQLFHGGTTRA